MAMHTCKYVNAGITWQRLDQIQPKLVHVRRKTEDVSKNKSPFPTPLSRIMVLTDEILYIQSLRIFLGVLESKNSSSSQSRGSGSE